MDSQNHSNRELETLQKIVSALQKILGLHRQLWDQVRNERTALVNADRNAIQEAALAKQALVESVRGLESNRQGYVAELGQLWRRPSIELFLSEIIVTVQNRHPKVADALRTNQNALRVLVERVQAQNESNRQLVETSMKHLDSMKRNLMGEVEPRSALYTPQGAKGQGSAAGAQSRFLSREA